MIWRLVFDQRCNSTRTEILENWTLTNVYQANEVLDAIDEHDLIEEKIRGA